MTAEEWHQLMLKWQAMPSGTWERAMFVALVRRSEGGAWEVRARRWPGMGWMYYPCKVGGGTWRYLTAWRAAREGGAA